MGEVRERNDCKERVICVCAERERVKQNKLPLHSASSEEAFCGGGVGGSDDTGDFVETGVSELLFDDPPSVGVSLVVSGDNDRVRNGELDGACVCVGLTPTAAAAAAASCDGTVPCRTLSSLRR